MEGRPLPRINSRRYLSFSSMAIVILDLAEDQLTGMSHGRLDSLNLQPISLPKDTLKQNYILTHGGLLIQI